MSTRESCQGQVLRCTFEEVIQTKSRASCIRPFSVQAKLKSQTCHQPGERRQEENRSTHQAICFGMPALCGRCRLCRSDEVARLLKGQARYFCLLMSSRASPRFSCGLHMIPQCLRGAPRIFGVKSGAQFVFPKLQTKAVEHLLYNIAAVYVGVLPDLRPGHVQLRYAPIILGFCQRAFWARGCRKASSLCCCRVLFAGVACQFSLLSRSLVSAVGVS